MTRRLLCVPKKLACFPMSDGESRANKRHFARMLSDPENKGVRQDHVNFDVLGTWDSRINFPMLLQESIKVGKPIPLIRPEDMGVASVLGRRTHNEDRFKLKELQTNFLYFAIFDGHGGSLCADFCSENMEKHIKFWLRDGEDDLETVLTNSFIDLNNSFGRYVTYGHPGNTSGTTATVCLLRNGNELAVGHVGDCRALLCRNGEVRKLTIDHTAEHKLEKERIVKSKGYITVDSLGRGLVNGRLAMTRSLGDMDLKPYGVIPLPDTRTHEVKHGKDAFIIITSDGINFVMNDQEIINAVNTCRTPQEAAQFVADQALYYSCEDNATALVVPFGAWGKFTNTGANLFQQSFGRELSRSMRH